MIPEEKNRVMGHLEVGDLAWSCMKILQHGGKECKVTKSNS